MYESPTLTIHGLPAPGPSAWATCELIDGNASPADSNTTAIPTLRMNIPLDVERFRRHTTAV
jgi:hypothetical protein